MKGWNGNPGDLRLLSHVTTTADDCRSVLKINIGVDVRGSVCSMCKYEIPRQTDTDEILGDPQVKLAVVIFIRNWSELRTLGILYKTHMDKQIRNDCSKN